MKPASRIQAASPSRDGKSATEAGRYEYPDGCPETNRPILGNERSRWVEACRPSVSSRTPQAYS